MAQYRNHEAIHDKRLYAATLLHDAGTLDNHMATNRSALEEQRRSVRIAVAAGCVVWHRVMVSSKGRCKNILPVNSIAAVEASSQRTDRISWLPTEFAPNATLTTIGRLMHARQRRWITCGCCLHWRGTRRTHSRDVSWARVCASFSAISAWKGLPSSRG